MANVITDAEARLVTENDMKKIREVDFVRLTLCPSSHTTA